MVSAHARRYSPRLTCDCMHRMRIESPDFKVTSTTGRMTAARYNLIEPLFSRLHDACGSSATRIVSGLICMHPDMTCKVALFDSPARCRQFYIERQHDNSTTSTHDLEFQSWSSRPQILETILSYLAQNRRVFRIRILAADVLAFSLPGTLFRIQCCTSAHCAGPATGFPLHWQGGIPHLYRIWFVFRLLVSRTQMNVLDS